MAFLSRLGSSEGPLPSMSRTAMSLESFQARFLGGREVLYKVHLQISPVPTTSWRMNTDSRNDFGLLLSTITRPLWADPIYHRWLLLRILCMLFRCRLRPCLLLKFPIIRPALLVLAKQVAEFTSNLLHHISIGGALPFVITRLLPQSKASWIV
ncbi:hypothetical protein EDD85DRAFT_596896 [Armillaria nabsnona]|nr:hypothetical protein EDD85DRAFT_596896 [Armillaria nabsnona]